MTAYTPRHAFNVVPGQPQPSLAALFFRRLRLRWKPSAPARLRPTAVLRVAGADTAAERFACCVHCDTEPCDPRDNHLAPCSSGCNRPAPSYTQTAPIFIPSQLLDTGPIAALREPLPEWASPVPWPRPVNGRSLGTLPRRQRVPDAVRGQYGGPPPSVLKQVLKGLRKLDEPGFGVDRCEADVLAAEQAGRMVA